MLSTTAFLALAMQCAPSVHPDTALAVARVESGLNPYAIGIVGVKKGLFPESKNQALSHVNQLKTQGKRYSLGLMQITSTNFKTYHVNDEQLFNPCTNLAIFEKIMTDCYQRGGSLKRALSCYYAGNFSTGQKKEETFNHTSYVERIGYKNNVGYKVPSVKEDKGELTKVFINKGNRPLLVSPSVVVYPSHFVRGDVQY
ncbi:lytic transglycosylase domain-containing protein [Arsenophonus nasoniae]|uniref:Lytic transglycosylase domain-containing protein n=1 Tax=Arsenophonus nasoniae TaxID=638 RepID=A0ABY8NY31_9GAMM|nr:lytic transglycosylase domain-containing protein [Arsenophonus nasoniae]WGM08756.1 lytic transglycosylase domain-containing protein [Arsenophonus nasoniae]